jgi:hypothetical protein
MEQYFIGQGSVYTYERDVNGNPINGKWMGDCDELKVGISTEDKEIYENHSGQRGLGALVTVGKKASVTINAKQVSTDQFAMSLYGTKVSTVAGAVAVGEPESLGTVVVGEHKMLAHMDVTDLVIKDSTAVTPVTLVEGTHYRKNAKNGSIDILSITDLTMPLLASYSYGASSAVGAFSASPTEKVIGFEGINLVTGKPANGLLFRVKFKPQKELSFIGQDYMSLALEGEVLIDTKKDSDSDFGQFFKFEMQ